MPTLHNPLGTVMNLAQREALVAIARRHKLLIIEDAAYAFLVEDPPPPIAVMAPDITVYVSGFSKSVATGIRVGMVAAPERWVSPIERAIRATTWNTPGVMTAMIHGWLEDGTVMRLEAAKRADALARQAIARDVFAGMHSASHPAAYFIWLAFAKFGEFGEEARADVVASALMREKIAVSTAAPFATSEAVPHALRLALGSVEMEGLRPALEKVKAAIARYTY